MGSARQDALWIHDNGDLLKQALGNHIERMRENEGVMLSVPADSGMITPDAARAMASDFNRQAERAEQVLDALFDILEDDD